MKREEVNRLGGRYSDCMEDWPKNIKLTQSAKDRWQKYSPEVCQRYCILNEMAKNCSFIDSYDNEIEFVSNIKESTYSNETNVKCRNSVYERYRNSDFSCNCSAACKSVEFITHTSRSSWPSRSYVSFLAYRILRGNDTNKNEGKSKIKNHLVKEPKSKAFMKALVLDKNATSDIIQQKIAHNFVRLEIFYETFKFRKISESAAYDMMDLISDFGGNIGLWLSWSVFALFEVLIFFLHCIEALYLKEQN